MSNVINNLYIPEHVLYDNDLCFGARLLFGIISKECLHKNSCTFTNAYIGELFNITVTTASQWISSLSSKNYISTINEYVDGTNCIKCRHIFINELNTDNSIENSITSSYIYLFEDKDGLIKIGISKNPNKRKLSFNSRKVKLLYYYYIDNSQELEKMLHDKYKDYRVDNNAEWFDFKNDKNKIISEIKEIIKNRGNFC